MRSKDTVVECLDPYGRMRERNYKGRILVTHLRGKERRKYPMQTLKNDQGERKQWYVHDLVMLAFIGPKPDGMEVCHRDDNEINCVLSNLYYGTSRQNAADRVRNGRQGVARGEANPQAKLNNEKVRWVKSMKGVLSERAIAKRVGVSRSVVRGIHLGEYWKHVE